MERNIALISEIEYCGKIEDDYSGDNPNVVTMVSKTLNATMLNYFFVRTLIHNDNFNFTHAIIIPSKNHPEYLEIIDFIKQNRPNCKVMLLQEGAYNFWLDWSMEFQKRYFEYMKSVDYFIYNNDVDANYYKQINAKSIKLRVPIDCDFINKKIICGRIVPFEKRKDYIVVGGSCNSWYNGTNSFIVANESKIKNIVTPTMGRDQKNEEYFLSQMFPNKEIKKLPFLPLTYWAKLISEAKYCIHLMPTVAGGNMVNICASVGTPIIGNELWDTQKECFHNLAIDVRDIVKGASLVKILDSNFEFYEDVSNLAKNKCTSIFDIPKVREHFFKQLDDYELI
jgi:hypothetical protein